MLYTLRDVYLTYVFMLLIGSYNVFCMDDQKNINDSSVLNSLVEQSGEEVDSEVDNNDAQEAGNPYESGRQFVQQAFARGMNDSEIVREIVNTDVSYEGFAGAMDELKEGGIDPRHVMKHILQGLLSEKQKLLNEEQQHKDRLSELEKCKDSVQWDMLESKKSIVEQPILDVENLLNEGGVSGCISETEELLVKLDQALNILIHDMSADKKDIDNLLNNIEGVLKNIMIKFYKDIFKACEIDVFVESYKDLDCKRTKIYAEYNNMCQQFGKDNELQVRIDNVFGLAEEIQNRRQDAQKMISNICAKINELKK